MASNKPESWGFQGIAELLKDLGPREGQRKVYQGLKEFYQSAVKMSAGEPAHDWRPPGQDCNSRQIFPGNELRDLASRSLQTVLKLRQKSQIS